MIYDKEADKNFDKWISLNRNFFTPEILESIKKNSDLFHLISGVYPEINKEVTPSMRSLMYRQYPILKTEIRPLIMKFIDSILNVTGTVIFLMKMYSLVYQHKSGANVRDFYPDLDKWAEFYCNPPKPSTVNENDPPTHWQLSDTEWKTTAKTENTRLSGFFQREQNRKSDFINLLQQIYSRHYPELLNLSSDESVIFTAAMNHEYDFFKSHCEYIEEFIKSGFPEEYIDLPDKDYLEQKHAG